MRRVDLRVFAIVASRAPLPALANPYWAIANIQGYSERHDGRAAYSPPTTSGANRLGALGKRVMKTDLNTWPSVVAMIGLIARYLPASRVGLSCR